MKTTEKKAIVIDSLCNTDGMVHMATQGSYTEIAKTIEADYELPAGTISPVMVRRAIMDLLYTDMLFAELYHRIADTAKANYTLSYYKRTATGYELTANTYTDKALALKAYWAVSTRRQPELYNGTKLLIRRGHTNGYPARGL